MSDIKKWKTPAASNVGSGFTPPDGFPEGMLRSDVNNSMREIQASMRRLWDDPDWKDPVDGFTVVQGADSTKVKIQATDATGYFNVNQKVRVRASSSPSGYAFVTSVAMAGSDTVVTLEDFDSTGTPTPSSSVPADCNGIDVYFLGGGDTTNHGIGRSAFESGASTAFEVPSTNDAAGINAAIVAASANGKAVLIPAVTIVLTDAISIPAASDNLKIMGMGVGSTVLKRGDALASKDVITVADDADNIIIENMKIDGNCTNNTTAGHGISFGNNVQSIRLRDLWIVNCWSNAINFGGTDTGGGENYSDIWIESSEIVICGDTGIYITDPNGTNDRIFISDVSIQAFGDTGDATTSDADACGIDISGRANIQGVLIEPENSATQHASFAGAALRLHQSGGGGAPPGGRQCQVSNFRIAGNMAGATGLHLRGADCQVSNGYIDLSGGGTIKPISVEGAGTGAAAASDVIISNVNVADGTRSEILGTTERVLIESCHFTAASETGLLVGGDYTKVLNCSFDGGTAGIAKGIEVQSGADGVEIKGCLIRGCSGVGITLTGDTSAVTDCTIEAITGDAIVVNGDNNVIQGNVLRNLTADGIQVNSGADTTRIMGNTFYVVGGVGVNLVATSTNGVISGNHFHSVSLQHVLDASTGSVVSSTNSPLLVTTGQVTASSTAQTINTGSNGEVFFSVAHPQAELGSSAEHTVTITFSGTGLDATSSSQYELRLWVGTSGDTSDEEVHESANITLGDQEHGPGSFIHVITYTPSAPIALGTKLTGTLDYASETWTLNSYTVTGAYRTQDVGQ